MSDREPGDVANRFLFENERVRVCQMDLAPGEASDFHEDADLEDGRTLHIPVAPGRVFFVPAGSRETAVNRSTQHFREIRVELKDAGAQPAASTQSRGTR